MRKDPKNRQRTSPGRPAPAAEPPPPGQPAAGAPHPQPATGSGAADTLSLEPGVLQASQTVLAEYVERGAPPPAAPAAPPARVRLRPTLTLTVPPPTYESLETQVRALIAQQGTHPDADLIEEMMLNALKLIRDGAPRMELRIMAAAVRELRYAFKVFRPYRGKRKVTVFGSARTPRGAPEYEQARAFAAEMVRRGYMVITGAGPGIMEAAQAGAGRGNSFGMNIRLPFEQAANPYILGDRKLIYFRYFFTRKLCFVKEASGIALFPGGLGTLDEGYETLTLIQTGKAAMIPVVLVDRPGGEYWRHWLQYMEEHVLGQGLISADDMSLFRITEDIQEAADEITRFYRRYHSSRLVKDQLVLRLASPLPSGALDDLNRRFGHLMETPEGRIVESGPLPDEADQPELAALPRLVLPFNRRDQGGLRKMVDAINEA